MDPPPLLIGGVFCLAAHSEWIKQETSPHSNMAISTGAASANALPKFATHRMPHNACVCSVLLLWGVHEASMLYWEGWILWVLGSGWLEGRGLGLEGRGLLPEGPGETSLRKGAYFSKLAAVPPSQAVLASLTGHCCSSGYAMWGCFLHGGIGR